MGVLKLDNELKDMLRSEFIEAIKDEGLILVPENYGEFVYQFKQQQQAALSAKTITPYKIAKLSLLPGVKTLKTVKDMIADGRISKNEWFPDSSGKIQVLTQAVKRLRDV